MHNRIKFQLFHDISSNDMTDDLIVIQKVRNRKRLILKTLTYYLESNDVVPIDSI